MKTNNGIQFLILSLFLALPGWSSLALADDHWSGNGKITVDGKSKSAGTLSFEISFKPGEEGTAADSLAIDVPVSNKVKQNDIAGIIANSLSAKLGDKNFKVGINGGNKVKVTAKGDSPYFAIEMTSNSVQGISLKID
jgi:hypothetical protein